MAVLLAVIATITPTPAQETPAPYWDRIRGCGHGHDSNRHDAASTAAAEPPAAHPRHRRRRHHVIRCQTDRSGRHRLTARRRELRRWRMAYENRWRIAFNRLQPWEQAWAYSTGACESGNNPATATGNGYYGGFQFLPSTWWAAGGTGTPSQHSWHYQAVIAVGWMRTAGAGQWPVAGERGTLLGAWPLIRPSGSPAPDEARDGGHRSTASS